MTLPTPSLPLPAELAGVIHVGARLNVAFVGVVDGRGSGVGTTQDEDEAVEGDGWRILVVCGQKCRAVLLAFPTRPGWPSKKMGLGQWSRHGCP